MIKSSTKKFYLLGSRSILRLQVHSISTQADPYHLFLGVGGKHLPRCLTFVYAECHYLPKPAKPANFTLVFYHFLLPLLECWLAAKRKWCSRIYALTSLFVWFVAQFLDGGLKRTSYMVTFEQNLLRQVTAGCNNFLNE